MKITVHSSELNRMMKAVNGCLTSRLNKNANIEVTMAGGKMTVHGMDDRGVSVLVSTGIGTLEEERFLVDGKSFKSVTDRMSGDVEIQTDEKGCTLRNIGRTRLTVLDAAFPAHDEVDGTEIVMDAAKLRDTFSRVAYACSQEETRQVLTGVLVECRVPCSVRMVALDGYQMALEDTEGQVGGDVTMIVPVSTLRLVCDSVPDGKITIRTDGKRLTCKADNISVTGTLLSGQFVDYKRILPASFATEAMLDTAEFRTALKNAATVSGDNHLIRLEITGDGVRIASNSATSSFDAELPWEVQGGSVTIAFNERFLLNALGVIGTEQAEMKLVGPVNAAVMTEHGGTDGVHLMLPVRVQ